MPPMPHNPLLAKLDSVKALHEAATKGPWRIGGYKDGEARLEQKIDASGEWHSSRWVFLDPADATLLVASRTLVPAMENLIRAQQRVIEAKERFIKEQGLLMDALLNHGNTVDFQKNMTRTAGSSLDDAESALAAIIEGIEV